MLKLKSLLLTSLTVLALAAACRPADGGNGNGGDPGAPTGQFDCSGHEGGLIAYAGRFTFEAGGDVSFDDYDGVTHTGSYTYNADEQAFEFASGFVFEYAEYFSDDTLTAAVAADASLPHAELGEVNCERAVPGVTGP